MINKNKKKKLSNNIQVNIIMLRFFFLDIAENHN